MPQDDGAELIDAVKKLIAEVESARLRCEELKKKNRALVKKISALEKKRPAQR